MFKEAYNLSHTDMSVKKDFTTIYNSFSYFLLLENPKFLVNKNKFGI